MKTAVLGAGAVGCYFGGMLARAGREVVLIGRPLHVAAIERDGLYLDTLGFKEHVDASTSADSIAGADMVLCCVKSTDSLQAAAEMAPHLAPDAIVLSLQNGYDNAARLAAALGRPVHAAVVYVATEMAGPGHLRHHGRGELVIGPFAGSDVVVAEFALAGVPVQVADNVSGQLWAKLIINCVYNGLSAITQLPYGEIAPGEGIAGVMEDIVAECLAVAAADGVDVPGDIHDVARGRKSEIDHINGYVLKRGAAHGIATPVNRTVHALVRLLEERNARPA